MAKPIITQEELVSLFNYDPLTGVFVRKVKVCNKSKLGEVAGTINACGYLAISIYKKIYLAHRLAWLYMTGEFPKEQIDHINMNRQDNRWCNLRIANKSENMSNRSKQVNNTSGYKGVYLRKDTNKYVARINVNGLCKILGNYKSAEMAYQAYIKAAKKYHGEFYRG